MKKTGLILILTATAILSSCQVKEIGVESFPAPEIVATLDNDTKTALIYNPNTGLTHVNWSPEDELNVFFGSRSVKYISTNTEYSGSAVFATEETLSETELNANSIWGLYPYDAQAQCDGAAIRTSLPSRQKGVAGTFDNDLAIMVANGSDTKLFFRNVCGGLKFTLTRDDIKSVTIKGNRDEPLAGSFKLGMSEGYPVITSPGTESSITLVPKTGETFRSNEEYLIMTLPAEMENGFTITFGMDNAQGTFVYDAHKVTLHRSGLAVKRDLDSYATFHYDVISISLNETQATLKVGSTLELVATVTPDNASEKTVTWRSSDESVATVENGIVTALKIGNATITAEAGGKTASCDITVEYTHVESVALNMTALDLTEGDEFALKATVSPAEATDKSVTFTSDNPEVASVSPDGLVKALATGSATITVSTTDGAKTATCVVNVRAKLFPVTGVSLNKTSLTLNKYYEELLVATVTPDYASNQLVNWSSDNTDVATVDVEGVVLAVSGGVANITATTVDGGYTATCVVTVYSPVTSVSLDKSDITLIVGGSETLLATVNPSDATDKSISWSSTRPEVASVDAEGNITALSNGSATIIATTNDGGKTAMCSVTVVTPVESVSLNKSTLNLPLNQTETLVATINPETASNRNISWSSTDNRVVTVKNGVVTAVGLGTATITVTTEDGGKKATCTVVVKKQLEDYEEHELF